jgi:hypothetical protein
MAQNRLLNAARTVLVPILVSVTTGWAVLIILSYAVEHPLILWSARWLGAHWVATAKLSLDCLILAATGWIIGRTRGTAPMPGVVAFAVTLAFGNFDPSLGIDFPALVRLAEGALGDTRLLNPLVTTAAQHLFLFGSLIVGGLLSRPPGTPLSLFEGTPSKSERSPERLA